MAKKQTKLKLGLVTESNAKYHGDLSAISKSRLAKMDCPARFKYLEEHPEKPSEDKVLGSGFHKAVLEASTFQNEFAILPQGIDRRTKAGREEYDKFLASVGKREILTNEQYETICSMKDSIMSNKYFVQLLKGKHEKSFYAVDDLTGERIKARPDSYRFVGDRLVITDLKSCKSARNDEIVRATVRYSYDLQCYMYSYILSKVLNVPMENIDFIFAFVEKEQPHLYNIVQATKDVFDRGEMLFRELIGRYHECKTENNWYGYNGKNNLMGELTLPDYLTRKE